MNKWTLMVYISADDILVNFAVESLKQMKREAGDGVMVVAQFDTNVGGNVSRYVFSDSGRTESSIRNNLIEILQGPVDMTNPTTLAEFIDTVTDRYPAEHYGLVLWGHGPELLFDDDVQPKTPSSNRAYFTPGVLRQALKYTKLVNKQLGKATLDIVAIDACCMAMMEVAGELQSCTNYLIASQDDVPDMSFPYEQVLERLKVLRAEGDVQAIAKMVPTAYEEAFQDYIATPANGLGGITLSTMCLQQIGTIITPVKQISSALLDASNDPALRKKILDARSKSHDFEFGLFVDLLDFCDQLDRTRHGDGNLTSACKSVRDAINGTNNQCIVANQTTGANSVRCHGISVYFPYQTKDVAQNTVLLSKNGTNHPTKDRVQRIAELEQDYSGLEISQQTGWMVFIKQGWSLILAKEVPGQLDTHYSAQQCAQNLLPDESAPSSQEKKPVAGRTNGASKATVHQFGKHQSREPHATT